MTHQPDTEMPNVHPIFLAESDRAGVEEINDLYATVETIVALMQRMTDEERMDVMSEFCRHCGDTNPCCQCWNDE
ncbi:MAG: hypothetical protein IPK63_18935 [Candidatus Competibacteraceae bacterium]|nr:hypothetical protein [Candidatus Competibacteraceae bacterium]